MKKILLLVMLFVALTPSFAPKIINASEIEVTKQEMLRDTSKSNEDSQVDYVEEAKYSSFNPLLVLLSVVMIVVLVGLLSTFVTKFALSLRGKRKSIYKEDEIDI